MRNINSTMDFLKVDSTESISTVPMGESPITVSRLQKQQSRDIETGESAIENALFLSVQLSKVDGRVWRDGKETILKSSIAGDINAFDHRHRWQIDINSSYDAIHFHLPLEVFASLDDSLGHPRVNALEISPGANLRDDAIIGLSHALLPALRNPTSVSRLFLDQVSLALPIHLATKYGKSFRATELRAGGLTPLHLNRVLERMATHDGNDLPLSDLAAMCGLSTAYFARAFKASTGVPPHRWLVQHRIERAKSMIKTSQLSLRDISKQCGFSDQSQLHRSFARIVGITPGKWRKSVTL